MPLGVLVTLANPGAIATNDLFRRFEVGDSSSSSSSSGRSNGRKEVPLDGVPLKDDHEPLQQRCPLDETEEDSYLRIPVEDDYDKSTFGHEYSTQEVPKIISWRGSKNNNNNRYRYDCISSKRRRVMKMVEHDVDDHESNDEHTEHGSDITEYAISSNNNNDDFSPQSSAISPFDIINKPLIFSIPGL